MYSLAAMSILLTSLYLLKFFMILSLARINLRSQRKLRSSSRAEHTAMHAMLEERAAISASYATAVILEERAAISASYATAVRRSAMYSAALRAASGSAHASSRSLRSALRATRSASCAILESISARAASRTLRSALRA